MIRPGALHRANGGYLLILDARKALDPADAAWDGAQARAARPAKIRIEPLGPGDGPDQHRSALEPESIPLNVKVAHHRRAGDLLCSWPSTTRSFSAPLQGSGRFRRAASSAARRQQPALRPSDRSHVLRRKEDLRPLRPGRGGPGARTLSVRAGPAIPSGFSMRDRGALADLLREVSDYIAADQDGAEAGRRRRHDPEAADRRPRTASARPGARKNPGSRSERDTIVIDTAGRESRPDQRLLGPAAWATSPSASRARITARVAARQGRGDRHRARGGARRAAAQRRAC